MKLRYPWLTGSLLASGAFSGALWYAGRAPIGGERDPRATVRQTSVTPLAATAEPQRFIGVLVSRAALDLTPRMSGRLKQLLVTVGQTVKAGDLVALLDDEPIRKDLRLAQAALAAARAGSQRASIQLDEARDKTRRRLQVRAELSSEEISGAESAVRLGGANVSAAQAAVAEQRARVDKMQESLTYTEIRAPFPGKISTSFVAIGGELTPQTPVVRIVQNEALCVRFAVPVAQVPKLVLGRRVRLALDGLPVAVPGLVENISPEVDPGSQMVYVEASVELSPESSRELKPGLVARVTLADADPPRDGRSGWQEPAPK